LFSVRPYALFLVIDVIISQADEIKIVLHRKKVSIKAKALGNKEPDSTFKVRINSPWKSVETNFNALMPMIKIFEKHGIELLI